MPGTGMSGCRGWHRRLKLAKLRQSFKSLPPRTLEHIACGWLKNVRSS
jgi:hypothetical protein